MITHCINSDESNHFMQFKSSNENKPPNETIGVRNREYLSLY